MSFESFPVRVEVVRMDGDTVSHGAHEILDISPHETSTRTLAQSIKDQFQDIEKCVESRVNISDRCVWGPDYHVDRMRVLWDTGSLTWDTEKTLAQTILTDRNFRGALAMLRAACPQAALSVLITRNSPRLGTP